MRKLLRWSLLRSIGNSQPAKATILVPLVGYLILFNDQFLSWITIHPILEAAGSEPNPQWRLFFMYFGLVFIALGTILYTIRCPSSHKKYGDAHDYASNVVSFHLSPNGFLDLHRHLVSVLRSNVPPASTRKAAELEIKEIDRAESPEAFWTGLKTQDQERKIRLLLLSQYNLVDFLRQKSIVAVFILYTVGFALLAIPSLTVFIKVCAATWKLFGF